MRRLSAYGPSLIVLGTATLVLFAGPFAVRELTYARTQARIQLASQRLMDNPILEQINTAYRDIAELVEPSVVHISSAKRVRDQRGVVQTSLSSGSGWVWDELGHIVTNYHVIEEADRIEVQLHDGALRDAQVIGFDRFTDIAVIKVDPGRLIASHRMAADETVQQGDLVFAFGSPFDFRFSMSSGVVSGIGRSVGVIRPTAGMGGVGYENFIQVDAAINPGNSGGPLTNYLGEVVGMNTAIATRREQGSSDEGQFAGIGLAIPMSMIEPVVTQLIDTGFVNKGFLGVGPLEMPRSLQRQLSNLGLPTQGVLVNFVNDDSPALRGGVLVGDIITAVDDTPIGSPDQLRATVSSKYPGDTIVLHVLRRDSDGDISPHELLVELELLNATRINGVLPENQDTTRIVELGIEGMANASEQLAREFDMLEVTPGVVITKITKGSRLARQITPGTTIVAVMSAPVVNVDQFIDQLRHYDLLRTAVRVAAVDPSGASHTFILSVEN